MLFIFNKTVSHWLDQGSYTEGGCDSQKGRVKLSINSQQNVHRDQREFLDKTASKEGQGPRRRRRRRRRQRRDPPTARPPSRTGSELKMLPR